MPIRPTTRSRSLLPAGLLLALLATCLAACGGGGGGGSVNPAINLGLLASTVSTTVDTGFTNPLPSAATVTESATVGPFSIDPADLPVAVAAGATFNLGLVFAPTTEGPIGGSVTLAYDNDGSVTEVTYTYQATAEVVVWSLGTPVLDFGQLTVGQTADLTAQFQNASSLSPVTLTSANLPNGHLSVVGTPFPITLNPGQTGNVTVRYAPTVGGTHNGNLGVGPGNPGGPILIPIVASAPGGGSEDVTDFGAQTFFGGLSAQLNVTVPADAISLTIECVDGPGETFGLGELIGPGARVYENTASTGPYVWGPGTHAFSTTVPNTDQAALQLVAGGGTYVFRVRRFSGGGTANIRAIVERRSGGVATGGILPLNIWLANGITPTAATATSDTRLQAILARIDTILGARGMSIGDIHYYDVTDPAYDNVTSGEFGPMLELTAQATETRLNLFFVNTAIGGGIVGVSATLAGPKVNGTAISGVMSIYSGFSTSTVGLIAAHELGHFLGLYHTVEEGGSHDFIEDTVECPATGSNPPDCPIVGGGYLMHWQAVGGVDLSAGQALVVYGHPLMDPSAGGGSNKPSGANFRAGPLPGETEDAWLLGSGWCGSCQGALRSK